MSKQARLVLRYSRMLRECKTHERFLYYDQRARRVAGYLIGFGC